tara:strand:+ start:45126 stop:46562 length:1437 start_codon:yes stop_codon:yes gene_type:complete
MIRFFSRFKNDNNSNVEANLYKKYPWLTEFADKLSRQKKKSLQDRLTELEKISNYINTKHWKDVENKFFHRMTEFGYPENGVKIEINLLKELFSMETIKNIFQNPSNSFSNSYDSECLSVNRRLSDNYEYVISPKGLILIVGSSNTILPVITASILSFLCGNVTVIQLPKLHQVAITELFSSLPFDDGTPIYFTNLDHQIEMQKLELDQLLNVVPWDVINIWGGREANEYYYQAVRKNSHRPNIINMEALTGILLIQEEYLNKNQDIVSGEVAKSISVLGQQLCSSPTEAYVICQGQSCVTTRHDEFYTMLVKRLEAIYDSKNSALNEFDLFKLDRVLNRATDNGSKVYKSKIYGNVISIISSENLSIFDDAPSDLDLNIHSRSNFLEFVHMNSEDLLINRLSDINNKITHAGIEKIQTIIVIGDDDFWEKAVYISKQISAYRVVSPNYVLKRHHFEPLDGYHLVDEFTYQIPILKGD